mgnify:CR=1 FL=1
MCSSDLLPSGLLQRIGGRGLVLLSLGDLGESGSPKLAEKEAQLGGRLLGELLINESDQFGLGIS